MASVVDAVAPHLAGHATVLPVAWARRPADVLTTLRHARRSSVVHLHPSLRIRALLRDGAVHRSVRALGARTVVQWHGVDRQLVERIDASKRARALVRRLYGDADRTFVLTYALASALRRWGIPSVEMVDNPAPPTTSGCPEPGRVLYLGRLEPAKGLPELVAAVGLLRRAHPACQLVVAGAGSLTPRGPGVTQVGWVDAVGRREQLARASVLALPTRDDAAPMAVLEALAAGVPVVATNVGAIPAMVGNAGRLVDRPDPASLAAAIEAVWRHPPPIADLSRHRPEAIAAHWLATYRALS